MPNEDAAASHSANPLELAKACEFDRLFEYLQRDTGRIAVLDERLLPLCVWEEASSSEVWDEEGIHVQVDEWEIRSAKSGWKVIELLVERYGADKSTLFQVAAHRGDVDVLEAACARKWHDNEGHTYCDILNAAGAGDDALVVFKWLAKSKDTYFLRNLRNHLRGLIRLQEEFTTVLTSVLRNEDIDAAAYMMNEPHALGYYYDRANLMGDDERRLYVIEAANGGAIKSLNFLCDRWGLELVTNYVREGLDVQPPYTDDDDLDPVFCIDPEYHDEIESWLNDVSQEPHHRANVVSTTKEHLMNVMATLDENKHQLAEGDYLKIVNELQEVYRGVNGRTTW